VKILLAPVGSAGDVYPYLGLGRCLKDRGHEVVVFTSAYFQEATERSGLRFVEVLSKAEFLQVTDDPLIWHPLRGPRRVMQLAASFIRRLYDALMQEQDRSTVIVSSCLGWGARLAEELHQVPLVTWHLQPAVIFSAVRPPKLAGMISRGWFAPSWNRRIFALGERFFLDPVCIPELNRVRQELGMSRVRGITRWWQSPRCVVGAFPAWFAPKAPDWPPHVELTEFPLWDEEGDHNLSEELERFLGQGPPPVVFTPGSANKFGEDFFQIAGSACEKIGCRGIMASRFHASSLDSLPPSCLWIRYASFARLLPQAAAIVHHGGIGTTARALASGIPQIVHPFSHDQPDNAVWVERLKAGLCVSTRHLTAEKLSAILQQTLNSKEIQQGAQIAARRIALADPFAEMCRIIESQRSADRESTTAAH
jgi:rhamnosyltransferase subunit B